MQLEIRQRDDRKFVEAVCRGVVTGAALRDAIADLRRTDGYRDGINALWDFRGADLSNLTVNEMKAILAFMEETPKRKHVHVAIVVMSEADILLFRLWREVSLSRYGQVTEVFRDYRLASEWLLEAS